MKFRVFYTAGLGKIIEAHEYSKRKEQLPSEVTITFSGQFEQYCQDIGAEAYIVGYNSQRGILRDGAITIEQRPKPLPEAWGAMFHVREIFYGLGLLATAVRFRANVAVIDSGTTHYFLTALFRLMGIRILPISAQYNLASRLPAHPPNPSDDLLAGFLVLPIRCDCGDRRLARVYQAGRAAHSRPTAASVPDPSPVLT